MVLRYMLLLELEKVVRKEEEGEEVNTCLAREIS
jgi:hypothetical protein